MDSQICIPLSLYFFLSSIYYIWLVSIYVKESNQTISHTSVTHNSVFRIIIFLALLFSSIMYYQVFSSFSLFIWLPALRPSFCLYSEVPLCFWLKILVGYCKNIWLSLFSNSSSLFTTIDNLSIVVFISWLPFSWVSIPASSKGLYIFRIILVLCKDFMKNVWKLVQQESVWLIFKLLFITFAFILY